jgi:apolipoprotein N-acyltransferase
MFAHGIHRWRQLRGGPQPLTEEQLSELRARRPTDDPSPDSLARGLHNRRQVQTYIDCVLTATAIFLFVLTGMGIRDRFERNFIYRAGQPGATKLRVGLIQTNINQLEKMRQYDLESDRARRDAVGRAYVGEALRLARSVAATSEPLDVIIFPEAMFIDPFFVFDESLHELMRQFSVEVGADLLFGADGWEELSTYRQRLARGRIVPEPGQQLPPDQFPKLTWEAADDGTSVGIVDLRNLARFVSVYQMKPREGLVPKVYHKVQLVPFGEHAPLLDWLPFNLAERLLWVAAFQKGTVIRQFESGGVPIGPLICFESTFGSLARDHARAGARVLAVMTNDAWYDPEYAISEGGLLGLLFRIPGLASLAASGPDQHLIQSRFRAIETRLPVVRVANRGRSAVILPDGNFAPNAGPLNFGVQGTLAVTVPIPAESDYVFVRRRHNGRRVIEPEKVSPLTYYVRAGDWAGWGSVIVLAVILLQSTAALVRRRAQP